jgi:hypothetical protein
MVKQDNPMKAITLLVIMGLAGLIVPSAVADTKKAGNMRADTDELYRHVVFLTSVVGYRHYANLKGLQRCANYIRSEMPNTSGRVWLQDFQANNNTYQNIICSLGPTNGPRIVVGAHYDVCGPQPGADDNASAVAGLLEIARLIGARRDLLKYRLDLVAYCLEEPPFFGTSAMGSYFHARSLREQKVSVKEMLCLEMIGFFSERENSQKFPLALMKWFYPTKANFIAVVSNLRNWQLVRLVQHDMEKATDLEVCKLSAPALVPGVGLSDHSNYWRFGFPAVMITDTAFYRNPNYHMPSDTIATLNFEKMAEVVNAVVSHLFNQQSR